MSKPRSDAPAHVIGFDDAPFAPDHKGDVLVVGAVYSDRRLVGVVSGKVRRDGRNSTDVLARLVERSRFRAHLQAVLTQGIALAGFNVLDLERLSADLGMPVIAVSRCRPDYGAIRDALLRHVRGGERKWRLIEKAGPMEPLAGLFVQRCGIGREAAERLLRRMTWVGKLPEPLRVAHLMAGGIVEGESRHRP